MKFDEPGSILHIYKIADYIKYNMIVFSIELGFSILAKTNIKKSKGNIYLLKYEDHYDLVTSPSGLLNKENFCEKCLVAFNKKKFHSCYNYCRLCQSAKCGEKVGNGLICEKCNSWCKNDYCLKNHKCDKIWTCKKCKVKFQLPVQKSYEKQFEIMYGKKVKYDFKDYHQCLKSWCRYCKKYCNLKTHICYIQPIKPKKSLQKYIYFQLQAYVNEN